MANFSQGVYLSPNFELNEIQTLLKSTDRLQSLEELFGSSAKKGNANKLNFYRTLFSQLNLDKAYGEDIHKHYIANLNYLVEYESVIKKQVYYDSSVLDVDNHLSFLMHQFNIVNLKSVLVQLGATNAQVNQLETYFTQSSSNIEVLTKYLTDPEHSKHKKKKEKEGKAGETPVIDPLPTLPATLKSHIPSSPSQTNYFLDAMVAFFQFEANFSAANTPEPTIAGLSALKAISDPKQAAESPAQDFHLNYAESLEVTRISQGIVAQLITQHIHTTLDQTITNPILQIYNLITTNICPQPEDRPSNHTGLYVHHLSQSAFPHVFYLHAQKIINLKDTKYFPTLHHMFSAIPGSSTPITNYPHFIEILAWYVEKSHDIREKYDDEKWDKKDPVKTELLQFEFPISFLISSIAPLLSYSQLLELQDELKMVRQELDFNLLLVHRFFPSSFTTFRSHQITSLDGENAFTCYNFTQSLPALPGMIEAIEKLQKVESKKAGKTPPGQFQHGAITSLDLSRQELCHPLDRKIFITSTSDLKLYEAHIPSVILTSMNLYENALQLINKNVKYNSDSYSVRQYYYSAMACFLMYCAQYGVYRFDLFDTEFNGNYLSHGHEGDSWDRKYAVSYSPPAPLSNSAQIWPTDLITDGFWTVVRSYIAAWYSRSDVKSWDIRKFTKYVDEYHLQMIYWDVKLSCSHQVYTAICEKPSTATISVIPEVTPAHDELVAKSAVTLEQGKESITTALGANNANNALGAIEPSQSIEVGGNAPQTSGVFVGKPYDCTQYVGDKTYNERLNRQLALHSTEKGFDYKTSTEQIFSWASEVSSELDVSSFLGQKAKGKYTIDEAGNIMLPLLVRNVKSVQLNVYEIDIFTWYQKELTKMAQNVAKSDGEETIPVFDHNIDLEGYIPNYSTKINLVNSTFDSGFHKDAKIDTSKYNPEDIKSYQKYIANVVLNGFSNRGVLIVELLNDTNSLRTCIHQGCFTAIQKPVKTGTLVLILDEKGRVVPDARVYIGGDQYTTFGQEAKDTEKDYNEINDAEEIVNSSFIHIPAYKSTKVMLLTDDAHLYTTPVLLKPKSTDISLTCEWFVSSESLTNAISSGADLGDDSGQKKQRSDVAILNDKYPIDFKTAAPQIVGGGHLGGEVLIRPTLYNNGTLIDLSKKNSYKSISVLKSALLVTATLQNGTEVTDLISNFCAFPAIQDVEEGDQQVAKNVIGMRRFDGVTIPPNEAIHPFAIPAGLTTISFVLSLTIEFEGKETDLTTTYSTSINGIHQNESVSTGMLMLKQLNGSYFLYSVDKSGLPIPFYPLALSLSAAWLSTPLICNSEIVLDDKYAINPILEYQSKMKNQKSKNESANRPDRVGPGEKWSYLPILTPEELKNVQNVRNFTTDQHGCFELGSLFGISKIYATKGSFSASSVSAGQAGMTGSEFTNIGIDGGFSFTLPQMSQLVNYPTSITITINDNDIEKREHNQPTTRRSSLPMLSSASLLSSTLLTPASPSLKQTTLFHANNAKNLQAGAIAPQVSLPLPFHMDQEFFLLTLAHNLQNGGKNSIAEIAKISTTAANNYKIFTQALHPSITLPSQSVTHSTPQTPTSSSTTTLTNTPSSEVVSMTPAQLDIFDNYSKLQDLFYTYLLQSGCIQLSEMGIDPLKIKNREILNTSFTLMNNTLYLHNLQPNRNYLLTMNLPTGKSLTTMIRTYREPTQANRLSKTAAVIAPEAARLASPSSTTLSLPSLQLPASVRPPSCWGQLLSFLQQSDQTLNKIHDYLVLRNNAVVKIDQNSLQKHLISTTRAVYSPQSQTLTLQLQNIDYKASKLLIFGSTLATTPTTLINHINSYHKFTWKPELTQFTANPPFSQVNPRFTKISGGEISGEREYIDFRRSLISNGEKDENGNPKQSGQIGIMLPQPTLILNKRLRQHTDPILEKAKQKAKAGNVVQPVENEVNLGLEVLNDMLLCLDEAKECEKIEEQRDYSEKKKKAAPRRNISRKKEMAPKRADKMMMEERCDKLNACAINFDDDYRDYSGGKNVARYRSQPSFNYSDTRHSNSFYNMEVLRNKSLLLCNLNVVDLLVAQFSPPSTSSPTSEPIEKRLEAMLDSTSTVQCSIRYPLFSAYSNLLIYVYNVNTNTYSVTSCPIYTESPRLPYYDSFLPQTLQAACEKAKKDDSPQITSQMQPSFKTTSFNSTIPLNNQDQAYIEQHSIQLIPDNVVNQQSVILCQQNSIEYELVSNLTELFTMMLTMVNFSKNRPSYDKLFYTKFNNNSTLTDQNLILTTLNKYEALYCNWASKLTMREKLAFYDRFYCHEVNLYLFFHDRVFFECVVRPHLVQKLSKDIIDLWLLSQTVLDQSYFQQAHAHYTALQSPFPSHLLPLPTTRSCEFYKQQVTEARAEMHFIYSQYFASPSGSITSSSQSKHTLNVLEIILLLSTVNQQELFQLGYFMKTDRNQNQSYSRDNSLYITLFESCLRRKMLTLQTVSVEAGNDNGDDANEDGITAQITPHDKEDSEMRVIYREDEDLDLAEGGGDSGLISTLPTNAPFAIGGGGASAGYGRGGPCPPAPSAEMAQLRSVQQAQPSPSLAGLLGATLARRSINDEECDSSEGDDWDSDGDGDGDDSRAYKTRGKSEDKKLKSSHHRVAVPHRAKDRSTLDDVLDQQLRKKKPKSHTPYVPLGKTGEYEDKFYYIAPQFDGKLGSDSSYSTGLSATGQNRNTYDFVPYWTLLWCDFAQHLGNPETFSIDNDYSSANKVNKRFVSQHLFDIADSTVNEHLLFLSITGLSNNPLVDKAHVVRNISGAEVHQAITAGPASPQKSPFARTIPINSINIKATATGYADFLAEIKQDDATVANNQDVMYTVISQLNSALEIPGLDEKPTSGDFVPLSEKAYPFLILTKQLQPLGPNDVVDIKSGDDSDGSDDDNDDGDDHDDDENGETRKKMTLTAKHYYIDILKSQSKGKLIVTKPNKFQYNRPYRCQVVLTNLTSSTHSAQVYVEIPQNSLPISIPYGVLPSNSDSSATELGGVHSSTQHLTLDPYGSQIIAYSFYIPKPINVAPTTPTTQPSDEKSQKSLKPHSFAHYGAVITTTDTISPKLFYHVPQIILECCPVVGFDFNVTKQRRKKHDGSHDDYYIANHYSNDELCTFLEHHFAYLCGESKPNTLVDFNTVKSAQAKCDSVFELSYIFRRLLVNLQSPSSPVSPAFVKSTFEFYLRVLNILRGYFGVRQARNYHCDYIMSYAWFWLRIVYMMNFRHSELPLTTKSGEKLVESGLYIALSPSQMELMIWALNFSCRKRSNNYFFNNRDYVTLKQFNHYDYHPYSPARIHNTSIGMNTNFIREQQEALLVQQLEADVSAPAETITPEAATSIAKAPLSFLQTIFHGDVINTNIPNAQLQAQYQQLLTFILMNTSSSSSSSSQLDPFPALGYQYILSLIYYTLLIQQSTTPQLFTLISVLLNKIGTAQQTNQATFTSHIQFAYLISYIDILFMGQLHTKINNSQFATLRSLFPSAWKVESLPAASETDHLQDFFISSHLCRTFKTFPIPQWSTLFNQTEQYLLEGFVELSLQLAGKKVQADPLVQKGADQVAEEQTPLQYDENNTYNVELQRSIRQSQGASNSPTLNSVVTHTPTTTIIDIIYNDKIVDSEFILELFYIDSELLLSQNPFIQSQSTSSSASSNSTNNNSNVTKPHVLVKVPVIYPTSTPTPGLYKQSVTLPSILTTNANVTIKAIKSALVTVVPLLHSGFIVQIQEKQGILTILNSTTMKPVSGAYIKVFNKVETVGAADDQAQVDFLCDKYTDIRGKSSFMDASNAKPGNDTNNGQKRTKYAIIVSHQKLGTTVAYCNGPQK